MERMTEKVEDSDYKRYIHFLSVSNWSALEVNNATLKATDNLLREQKKKSGFPTGLVITISEKTKFSEQWPYPRIQQQRMGIFSMQQVLGRTLF